MFVAGYLIVVTATAMGLLLMQWTASSHLLVACQVAALGIYSKHATATRKNAAIKYHSQCGQWADSADSADRADRMGGQCEQKRDRKG